MGKYKMWIIIGAVVLLLVLFFWWNSSRNKRLAAQAEQERLQQQYLQQTAPSTATGAASGTLTSLQGVIDSLANLFGKQPTTISESLRLQFANQCEQLYNTQAQVDACVAQKIASYKA